MQRGLLSTLDCAQRLRRGVLLTGLLWAFVPIEASEPRPYDIEHYDIFIEPDFAERRLCMRVRVSIANPNFERSFFFELSDRYESVKVKANTSPTGIKRDGGFVTVTVTKPTKKVSLVFELKGYRGKSNDEDRDVIDNESLFLLWSDRFYPVVFRDWATVKTTLVLPSKFQAIAPGRLTKIQKDGNKVRFVFETTTPSVHFSILADSRWIKTERELNGIRLQTLLHPESQKFAEQIFTTSSKILKFYSDIYCPYPFDQFAFVTSKGMYARRAFSGFVGYEPGYLEKEFATAGFDAHETALLWWGYTLSGDGPGSWMWTEGLGDYAEILYVEKYRLPIPKIYHYFRNRYLESLSEKDVLYSELRGGTDQAFIHGKYPWLMHLIRYVVGDDGFKRAMKLLFERFPFRTFSMEEFVATLEEGSGQSLQWIRDEWLHRRGVPTISLKSEIHQQEGAYHITCRLEQIGNIYRLPIEIGIETEQGRRIERVYLKEKRMEVSFQSKERPRKILLDPNEWILMKKMNETIPPDERFPRVNPALALFERFTKLVGRPSHRELLGVSSCGLKTSGAVVNSIFQRLFQQGG